MDKNYLCISKFGFRSSLGETPPCKLMAPDACKIRRGCNVLEVPIQVLPLGVPKRGSRTMKIAVPDQNYNDMFSDHPYG